MVVGREVEKEWQDEEAVVEGDHAEEKKVARRKLTSSKDVGNRAVLARLRQSGRDMSVFRITREGSTYSRKRAVFNRV